MAGRRGARQRTKEMRNGARMAYARDAVRIGTNVTDFRVSKTKNALLYSPTPLS